MTYEEHFYNQVIELDDIKRILAWGFFFWIIIPVYALHGVYLILKDLKG